MPRGEPRNHRRRQYLHVAREHDQLDLLVVDQRQQLRFLLLLRRSCHRRVEIADALRLDAPPHGIVVRDDSGELHRQVADRVAVEQIVEAVPEFRNQDQHAGLHHQVVQRPLKVEGRRDRMKPSLNDFTVTSLGAENETRMKKRSVSGSPYCALSTMLHPCEAMLFATAATMPAPVGAGKRQNKSCRLGGHGRGLVHSRSSRARDG